MNSKLKSIIINIVLFAVVVFLAIKVIQSIQAPINFNNEKSHREAQVDQRLKEIRDADIQFKQANSQYTSDFDSPTRRTPPSPRPSTTPWVTLR